MFERSVAGALRAAVPSGYGHGLRPSPQADLVGQEFWYPGIEVGAISDGQVGPCGPVRAPDTIELSSHLPIMPEL